MKLSKLSKADPTERLSLILHKSVLDQLDAYRAYYEATYGEPIAQSRIIEEVLKAFIASDKDFLKTVAAQA